MVVIEEDGRCVSVFTTKGERYEHLVQKDRETDNLAVHMV